LDFMALPDAYRAAAVLVDVMPPVPLPDRFSMRPGQSCIFSRHHHGEQDLIGFSPAGTTVAGDY
jgi:hypothetical protein